MERIESDRTAKRVYVEECAGIRSLINTVKWCLRKKGLHVRQAKRMVQNRSE